MSKKAFVLMPFQHPFNSYYASIFKPALEEVGFIVTRADDFFTPRPIMLDIQKSILESDLILCDMSNRNPNVFYELGLAHAIGRPTILVSWKEEDIPFDLKHVRVILYDYTIAGWEKKLRESIVSATLSVEHSEEIWPPPLIDFKDCSSLKKYDVKEFRAPKLLHKKRSTVSDKNIEPPNDLFPIWGISLGETNIEELAKLGVHSRSKNKENGELYNYYQIHGHNFWYDENYITGHMYLTHSDAIPEKWRLLGFDWDLSYNQWTKLFESLNYTLSIIKPPSVKKYKGHDSFNAEIQASKQTRIPITIKLYFSYSEGINIDSKGTLYSMRIVVAG